MSGNQIRLSHGFTATVSEEDFDWLSNFVWSASKSKTRWYAVRKIEGTNTLVRMHVEIWKRHHPGEELGKDQVDHENNNTMDNRATNLRRSTVQQNQFNSRPASGRKFKGVRQVESGGWTFTVRVGTFPTQEEAALAYDRVVKALRGAYAYQNFGNHSEAKE